MLKEWKLGATHVWNNEKSGKKMLFRQARENNVWK
jgi:hypothetical protein